MKWQDRLGSCNIIDLRHIDAEAIQFRIMGDPENFATLPDHEQQTLTAIYEETLENMAAAVEPGGLNGGPCREFETEQDAPMAFIEGSGLSAGTTNELLESVRNFGREFTEAREGHVITEAKAPQSDSPYAPETSPFPMPRP